jgi:hypothetical protein
MIPRNVERREKRNSLGSERKTPQSMGEGKSRSWNGSWRFSAARWRERLGNRLMQDLSVCREMRQFLLCKLGIFIIFNLPTRTCRQWSLIDFARGGNPHQC